MRQAGGTRRRHVARRRPLMAALLAGTALGGSLLLPTAARAEVATDGTLGRKVKLTGPDVRVGADLGRVRGKNLFHSFERFGVEAGGKVTFTGPSGLDNVVSRVTGGEPSAINGTLASTVPGADVYLVNPSGIVFGPGARLDVPGSFHASTADELRFSDGTAFSARDPGGAVLSVARPEAFGFLGSGRAGAIAVDRGALAVPPGETLALVGRDVTVTGVPDGTFAAGTLRADDGRLALTAAGGGASAVPVGRPAPGGAAPAGGRVLLTDQAFLGSLGQEGGTVAVRGGEVVVERASLVLSRNLGGTDSRGGVALQGSAVTVSGSLVSADTFAEGRAGAVTLRGDRVEIRDAAQVRSATAAGGDAGPVTVDAGTLVVEGAPEPTFGVIAFVSSTAQSTSTGDGGPVTVRAGTVELRNGGIISTDTFGADDAGTVSVEAGRLLATGDAELRVLSGVTSTAGEGARGDGGAVTVRAGEVELRDGGTIDSSTFGGGDGGSVAVEAGRVVVAERSQISGSGGRGSTGRGGSVTVVADEVELRDSGFLNSNAFGAGDAGPVTVVAGLLLVTGGSSVSTSTGSLGLGVTGAGGPVSVRAREVELRDRGLIQSDTFFDGGPAGSIAVEARELRLRSGGSVSSSAILSASPAGDVTLRVGRLLADSGRVQTSATGAQGGRIDIAADDLIALDDAVVTSTGITPAPGASVITLRAPLIALNASRVESLTGAGTPLTGSGEARLLGGTTIVSADSTVAASTTVETTGLENDLGSELQLAPGAFLDAGALLGEGCAARRGGRASSFTRAGRGGLPPSPDRPLASGTETGRGRAEARLENGRLLLAGDALQPAPAACGGAAEG